MVQKKPSKNDKKPVANSQLTKGDRELEAFKGSNDIGKKSEPKQKTKRITFEVSPQQHQATKVLAA